VGNKFRNKPPPLCPASSLRLIPRPASTHRTHDEGLLLPRPSRSRGTAAQAQIAAGPPGRHGPEPGRRRGSPGAGPPDRLENQNRSRLNPAFDPPWNGWDWGAAVGRANGWPRRATPTSLRRGRDLRRRLVDHQARTDVTRAGQPGDAAAVARQQTDHRPQAFNRGAATGQQGDGIRRQRGSQPCAPCQQAAE